MKDPTLGVIMQYPAIRILALDGNSFEIAAGLQDEFVYELIIGQEHSTRVIRCPSAVGISEILRKGVDFPPSSLRQFCSTLSDCARDLGFLDGRARAGGRF